MIQYVVGQVQVTSTFTDEDPAGVRWTNGVEGIAGPMKIDSNDALLVSATPAQPFPRSAAI